jgi:UDPglucose--hexose-1-phosphate uridylyltransferase
VVWIAGHRQDRPNLPEAGCPFCVGGLEAPEPYEVLAFPNRWPSMPGSRCEVVLYSPDHDATFPSLGPAGARRVVDTWAARTAALGARPDVAYVMPFENRGTQVGATIPHPHGQIYAFEEVPPAPARELTAGTCAVCDVAAHTVVEIDGWRTAVPDAARYPFELLVAPVAHRPDLPGLRDPERDAMAAALVDALGRLDRLFGEPMPYMLWVHQRPTDGGEWPLAHLHVEVAPLYRAPGTPRYVAAGELGSGVYFNPVEPADAAAMLRAAGP